MEAKSQKDTLLLKIGAYAEIYGGGSITNPGLAEKSFIFYNHTSYQKPDVNLAFVSFQLGNNRLRLQSDFMLGTYANKNLPDEGAFGKHIYQLNLQYQASTNSQWLLGVFPSHLGFESATNWDNPMVSRSYVAENSPYYESGISWNYQVTKQLSTRLLFLTGWQTINYFRPALGTQIAFKNIRNWSFSNGTFYGDEGKGNRFFLNNYIQIPLTNKWQTVLCFDLGLEAGKIWHGGFALTSFQFSELTRIGGRLEYYHDPYAVIMPFAFYDLPQSVNVDQMISKKLMLRSEFKHSEKFGNEWILSCILRLNEIVSQPIKTK